MSDASRSRQMRRELGRLLRDLRRQAGLSQQQVARQTGYTRSAVSNAEAGGYAQRRFWEQCDELFGSNGRLARAYDEIRQQTASLPGGAGKRGPEREAARQGLELLRQARDHASASQALAAYQKLGWPVEEHRGQLALVTGTVIDALELPRPAGVLATRWWLYTGGAADEVRGLPALPRPDQALIVIDTGRSLFFIARASGPWDDHDLPAPATAPAATAPAVRWHCRGSRIPLPPAQAAGGRPARWAHLPSRSVELPPAIGLLDLLAKAAATARHDAGGLAFPHEVLVIPVHGPSGPAPAGQPEQASGG